MGASEDDAASPSEGADSCGPSNDSIPAVRIWGPVPKEQAVAVGALAAASSMVLAPQLEHRNVNFGSQRYLSVIRNP